MIDGLSAQSASQRRSARNITDQVDRSGSSSHFRVRSPFLAGGGSLRVCAHSRPSLHSMEFLWIQRPPDARAGIALAPPLPALPVTDASWHTGAHPATLSDRVGHPNFKGASVACRRQQTTTNRPPQPSHHFTTCPHPPTSDHPPQTTCPPPTFPALPPFPNAPPRLTGAMSSTTPCPPSPPPRPPVQAAFPRRCRRLAPPSPPPRPVVADRRRRPKCRFLRSSCRHLPSTGGRCQGSKEV